MKKLILIIMFVIFISSVHALSLDDVVFNATGINTIVTINNEINASGVTVASDSIYFTRLNYSKSGHAAQGGESISFNITASNKSYTEANLPYFSASSGMAKTITSNLDETVDGSITFSVVTCTLSGVYYNTFGTTHDKTYTSGEWSCSDNFLTLNYTGLYDTGSFYAYADVIASECSVGHANASLYFSIYDEDTPANLLTADAEVELNYWVADTSQFVQNYTVEMTGNHTYSLCLNNNETSLNTDIYIKYTTDNGFTHRYILANHTLTAGSPENLSIYNFNTTTDISDLKITVRQNANYQYYSDVIAKLQRRYTAEGVWRTVQMDQSGDFGLVFFNIREETTDYRLIFTDRYNNILKTTDTLKFVCTDALCELTTLLDPYSASAASADIIVSYNYDNSTNILSFEWEEETGGTNTVRMRVRKDTITGAIYPCDVTQTGASGSYNCDLSGYTGAVEVTVIGNGEIILNEILELDRDVIGDNIDTREGALWAAIIVIICVTFGLFSPVAAVISLVIGLIAVYVLGIFTPLTITMIIIATVIAIVIGFKVRS